MQTISNTSLQLYSICFLTRSLAWQTTQGKKKLTLPFVRRQLCPVVDAINSLCRVKQEPIVLPVCQLVLENYVQKWDLRHNGK